MLLVTASGCASRVDGNPVCPAKLLAATKEYDSAKGALDRATAEAQRIGTASAYAYVASYAADLAGADAELKDVRRACGSSP